MAKRFTDTEKFSDTWYRKLSLLHKVIWEYLLAECNHAGIFENFDLEMMSFKIGAEVKKEDLEIFKDRIIFISDDVLFIPKFIQFQYGELNSQSKVHASVLKELEKYNINTVSKECLKSINTLKDKVKDKNKDKEKEKEKDKYCNPDFEKCFKIYSEICKNLIPLSFERRSREVIDELSNFLNEIDYDMDMFSSLCRKANDLKVIVKNKIDFRSMIRNYIGIMNGKYSSGNMNNSKNEILKLVTKRLEGSINSG